MDGLFAEVVVDAVDLRFVEVLRDLFLERFRRDRIAPKRLFDDDARPALTRLVDVVDESVFSELGDDQGKKFRLHREVKHPISPRRVASVELF